MGTFFFLKQPALITATYRILECDSRIVLAAEFVFLHYAFAVFTSKASPGRHVEWMNAKRLSFKREVYDRLSSVNCLLNYTLNFSYLFKVQFTIW